MRFRLVGIGELLWDLLPQGRQLGGAPANFAYHAAALGAEARLVSRVGRDDLGREAAQRLVSLGLPIDTLQEDASLPTGTVSVRLAPDGQPNFIIHENVAWDAIEVTALGRDAVARADGVCFGTLAQRCERSRATLRDLIAATPSTALRVFDVNLRQDFYSAGLIEESLRWANVLKINEGELARLAEMFGIPGDERGLLDEFARRFSLDAVACTRGARGSLLLARGQWSECPAVPTEVVDTIGAGDSFTAAMTLGLLAGWPLDEVNRRASALARFVCSQPGATPALPEALRAPFVGLGRPSSVAAAKATPP